MDATVIVAIIGAIATIVASIVAAIFSRRKDTKKSSDTELVARSAGTTDDTSIIIATLRKSDQEKTAQFSSLTVSKMKEFEYEAEVISVFKSAYAELVGNAFEHGWRRNRDEVEIIIDVTQAYVALTVSNPKGRKFDIEVEMDKNRGWLATTPTQRRGRGLLLVSELADSLESTANNEGIKAVFYKDSVEFMVETKQEDDLAIIEIVNGLYNPSFRRRLLTTASRYLQYNLILDFRRWVTSTISHDVILDLDELYAKSGKQIVALTASTDGLHRSEAILPDSIVAYSWDEALRKIFYPEPADKQPDVGHLRLANEIKARRDHFKQKVG